MPKQRTNKLARFLIVFRSIYRSIKGYIHFYMFVINYKKKTKKNYIILTKFIIIYTHIL